MNARKLGFIVALSAALAVGVAACGNSSNGGSSSSGLSGEVAGAGSSAQQSAQEAWTAGFQTKNSGVTISYDPVGSGGGRDQFISGGVPFAGSDAPFDSTELPQAAKRCAPGQVVEVPDYISPIAVAYNLSGVSNLQLDPTTIAKIFKQQITTWNDPAIAADNPGVKLPSTKITPVNRSDDSGTTENFTEYLSAAAPSVWTFPPDDTWPVKGGEAAAQTSGVVQALKAGSGTIGYIDNSQSQGLGVAKIKVGSSYVAPSAQGAANDLDKSTKDPSLSKGNDVLAFKIARTETDPSDYPILLVSYLMGCTQYSSSGTGSIVKGYFNYIVSPAGQAAAAKDAGSAPMSSSLRKQVQPAINAIKG